jgi:hypothetical protein
MAFFFHLEQVQTLYYLISGSTLFVSGSFFLLNVNEKLRFTIHILVGVGSGSSTGIATGYGLYGPRIKSRCGQDFPHLSRPAVDPTQPPVQWVPGFSRG